MRKRLSLALSDDKRTYLPLSLERVEGGMIDDVCCRASALGIVLPLVQISAEYKEVRLSCGCATLITLHVH